MEEEYRPLIEPYVYSHDVTGEEKDIIGSKENRSCIFCGKSETEVTFRKEAHIIPAGLGNRTLFNLNECDTCNEHHFSPQENDIVNFLTFDRIFIRAKKRSGKPKYRPPGKNSFMESTPLSNEVHLHILPEEGAFEVAEVGEKEIRLTIKNLPVYSPEGICKCLTHMAWSLLPKTDRQILNYVPNWLLGNISIFPLYLDSINLTKTGFSNVILEIWKSNNENSEYPIMIRFTYGFKILTFYLPLNPSVTSEPKLCEAYIQLEEDKAVTLYRDTIENSNKKNQDSKIFTFKYERRDELPEELKKKVEDKNEPKI